MIRKTTLRSLVTSVALTTLVCCHAASAATIQIGLLGLDLVYDGATISGPDTPADPMAPDPSEDSLDAVSFRVDGVLAGPVFTAPTSDLKASVSIPVTLPVVSPTPGLISVPSGPGIFDLSVDGFDLILDVADVTVTFVDSGTAQFVFGAEITTELVGQALPYGLTIGTPIDVSFNATITPGTLTDDGTSYTGFEASGGATLSGPLVPEPATLVLLGLLAAIGGAIGLRSRWG